jgi:hypothetical protein
MAKTEAAALKKAVAGFAKGTGYIAETAEIATPEIVARVTGA